MIAESRAFRSRGHQLVGRPSVVFGLVVILLAIAGAIFAPVLAPFDPNAQMFDGLTLEGAPLPPGGRLPARDRPARARSALAAALRGANLARHRDRRQRGGGADRGAGRGHGRILPRLGRRGPHGLHRPDDGLPGAAAGHRAGGDLPAEPVDRGAGHRHGELGAGGAGDLHRDLGAGRAGVRARRPARSGRRTGGSSGGTSCRTCCRR